MSFKDELSPDRKLFELIEKIVIVKGRLSTDPSVWEFHIGGEVLKIEASILENPKSFRSQYLSVFDRPAPIIKPNAWINLLDNLADEENNKIEHMEAPEESNNEFIARQMFEIICEREISDEVEDAENGRCLYNNISKKDGKQYYSIPSTALKDIIENAGFKIPLHELSTAMTELNMKCAATPRVWFNGKQKRSWCFVPETILREKGG